MADVARLAGVSRQTVSRVLNHSTNLRPETRQRVETAIRHLGYRPNPAARALATRRSATIGVVGSRAGLWGPGTVQRSIQAAGREAGYFVSSTDLQNLTRRELSIAVDHLLDQGVEGIVLVAAHDEALEVALAQEALGLPVVVVEGDPKQVRRTVGVDQESGAAQATEHLISLGHREIVHVSGPASWAESRARAAGWRRAMESAGLRATLPIQGDWSPAAGYEAGWKVAARREVTAVFCANDQMALGLMRALAEAGRSVPGDVSVVGFDDIPEAAFLIPPLTTVRQDFTAVGRRAIAILQATIAGLEEPPGLIAPQFVVRASTSAVSTSQAAKRSA